MKLLARLKVYLVAVVAVAAFASVLHSQVQAPPPETPPIQGLSPQTLPQMPSRVACLGDSITFGQGIADRETQSYPVQLGKLLGPQFAVSNYGVPGASLLRHSQRPYMGQDALKQAEQSQPQIVVLMLGSNDSNAANWRDRTEFAHDFADLVQELRAVASHPGVWVCLPPPIYGKDSPLSEARLETDIMPLLRDNAARLGVPIIDVHRALTQKGDLFSDGVHPNGAGAAIIAQTVRSALESDAGHQTAT